ncbi:MAG: hypothetical protein H0T45_14165 [Pyrinomonadaceae bacterium]|nr:hypothetical protein [Pyrinomonadaceae bacterium]
MSVFGRRGEIHVTPDVSHITNPDVSHETTDVRVKPIAWFVFGLFVFGVIVCVSMFGLFRIFEARAKADERPASPLARTGEERLPPEPRLQAAPGFGVTGEDGQRVDLSLKEPQSEYRVIRQQWEQELKNYGWADEGTGRVRVPIDEAKKMFLQRQSQQQPSQTGQQQGQQPPAGDEIMPSPSSSGQQGEKRNQ